MFLHVILEYAQQSILHKSLHKQRSNSKAISNVETFGLPTFKHTKIYTIFKASYWINGYCYDYMVCFSFYASCFVFWYVTATRIKLKSEIWASNGLSLKKINRKMENLVVAYPCLSWHFFQSWWCPLYRGFTVVFYISFSTSNAAQNA